MDIIVQKNQSGELVWDKSPKTWENRFPIQLIDEHLSTGQYEATWIALLSKTDFKIGRFENIVRYKFRDGEPYKFLGDLMTGQYKCDFMLGDVIRNPSIEEYKYIQKIIKEHGYIFNKRTSKFKKIK